MRIVVTGGAGFIGSHLVDVFIGAGHDVVVLDNLWSHGGGRRENINARASFVHMDIRDEDEVRRDGVARGRRTVVAESGFVGLVAPIFSFV